ncbi:MAG: metal ABC transporter permease, partial [Alphaproteobacteria bacterium]|nr:metal ABC transporter permease [Alphaproteobacteria bacterium]
MAHPVEEGDGAPSLRPLWALMPYLWPKDRSDLRARVVISMVCLVLAKVANAFVPYLNGRLVDSLRGRPTMQIFAAVMGVIVAQVIARIMISGFAQLRDGVFARVQYHAMRQVAVSTFSHIHRLSLRFHLDRKTGGLGRVIERGTKGIDTLLSIAIFNTFPTLLELAIDVAIFLILFNGWFAASTVLMVVLYTWFTFAITRWRIQFRRDMNQSDQDANTKAVDSLLNYETVKYFNNEAHETTRFDRSMERYTNASVQSTTSLTVLNIGQAVLMSLGLGAV